MLLPAFTVAFVVTQSLVPAFQLYARTGRRAWLALIGGIVLVLILVSAKEPFQALAGILIGAGIGAAVNRVRLRRYMHARLVALQVGRVPKRDVYPLLLQFGEARFLDAEPTVVGFVAHPDSTLRHLAISVLTFHWNMRKYRELLEHLLREDPDPRTRRIAAVGLGYVLRNSRDAHATELLVERLREPTEDASVREAAYGALLDIWFTTVQRIDARAVYAKTSARALAEEQALQEEVDWGIVSAVERNQASRFPRPE